MLTELSVTREIRVMELVRRVGSTYNELNRNLEILAKEGILTDEYRVKVKHGKVRFIFLNRDNTKTRTLLEVLKTLNNSTNSTEDNFQQTKGCQDSSESRIFR